MVMNVDTGKVSYADDTGKVSYPDSVPNVSALSLSPWPDLAIAVTVTRKMGESWTATLTIIDLGALLPRPLVTIRKRGVTP